MSVKIVVQGFKKAKTRFGFNEQLIESQRFFMQTFQVNAETLEQASALPDEFYQYLGILEERLWKQEIDKIVIQTTT
jgi:hypothetical protein